MGHVHLLLHMASYRATAEVHPALVRHAHGQVCALSPPSLQDLLSSLSKFKSSVVKFFYEVVLLGHLCHMHTEKDERHPSGKPEAD